jgi:hypothetical protein
MSSLFNRSANDGFGSVSGIALISPWHDQHSLFKLTQIQRKDEQYGKSLETAILNENPASSSHKPGGIDKMDNLRRTRQKHL